MVCCQVCTIIVRSPPSSCLLTTRVEIRFLWTLVYCQALLQFCIFSFLVFYFIYEYINLYNIIIMMMDTRDNSRPLQPLNGRSPKLYTPGKHCKKKEEKKKRKKNNTKQHHKQQTNDLSRHNNHDERGEMGGVDSGGWPRLLGGTPGVGHRPLCLPTAISETL